MRTFAANGVRRASLALVAALMCLTGLTLTSYGDPPELGGSTSVVKVEEDWELVVLEPDTDNQAPQVTCVTSPVGDLNRKFAVLDLNLKNLPSYEAGGMQLQLWNPNETEASYRSHVGELLSNPGETVTWTMQMSLYDNWIGFKVVDGHSQSWGDFGSGEYFQVWGTTSCFDLSGYTPEVSVANSGVSYAAHRVASLKIKTVRLFLSNGDVVEDHSDRVIYEHD